MVKGHAYSSLYPMPSKMHGRGYNLKEKPERGWQGEDLMKMGKGLKK